MPVVAIEAGIYIKVLVLYSWTILEHHDRHGYAVQSRAVQLMQIHEVPQATFHCDQLLTTNFLVLFRGIKQIQEVVRLHFCNTWVEQLLCSNGTSPVSVRCF